MKKILTLAIVITDDWSGKTTVFCPNETFTNVIAIAKVKIFFILNCYVFNYKL